MKLYKSLFIVTALVAGMLTSCSDDGVWDKAKPADLYLTEGTAYAFDATSCSYTYYPADVTAGLNIPVTVTRGNTDGQYTLPIKADFSDTEILSGAESVTFEAGQNTATYTIHVNKEIEIGQTVSAKLRIDTLCIGIPYMKDPGIDELDETSTHEDSVLYNNYQTYLKKLAAYKIVTTVDIGKDYNWKSLGKGSIVDNFWFENGDAPATVEIMQAVENANMFRVVNPWTAIADAVGASLDGNQTDIKLRLLQPGETFRNQTISQKNLVFFDQSCTGYFHSTYEADIWILHPSEFTAGASEDTWLHSKVTAYQSSGLPATIQLAPRYYMFGVGGWNQSQADGIMEIVFPGVKIYDYSAAIEYAGVFIDPDGQVYGLGDLSITGADAQAAQAMATIVSQDVDAEAAAEAIAAGDLLAVEVEDGRIQVPMPEDANGKLQIVVAFIQDNKVVNVIAAPFEYYSGANPWNTLGVGYLVDDVFYPTFTGADPLTFEVLIEEHSETPGLYRLKAPFAAYAEWWQKNGQDGDGNADIVVNAEDAEGVYIMNQPIGLSYKASGYGDMSIETEGGYYLSLGKYSYDVIKGAGMLGTVKDGIIEFPVFEQTDAEGNPLTDDDGNVRVFQGWMNFAGGQYTTIGEHGQFSILLPGATPSEVAKAQRAAKACDFERRMFFNAAKLQSMKKSKHIEKKLGR